jgi:hypothetical protein
MFKAWGAVLTSVVAMSASLYLISVSPWYLLPFAWFIAGTAFTGVSARWGATIRAWPGRGGAGRGRPEGAALSEPARRRPAGRRPTATLAPRPATLASPPPPPPPTHPPQFFVIGHDCGHRSFSDNKLLEDIVGTLAFMPLIYPFEPWRIKHNQHHAQTNKCAAAGISGAGGRFLGVAGWPAGARQHPPAPCSSALARACMLPSAARARSPASPLPPFLCHPQAGGGHGVAPGDAVGDCEVDAHPEVDLPGARGRRRLAGREEAAAGGGGSLAPAGPGPGAPPGSGGGSWPAPHPKRPPPAPTPSRAPRLPPSTPRPPRRPRPSWAPRSSCGPPSATGGSGTSTSASTPRSSARACSCRSRRSPRSR